MTTSTIIRLHLNIDMHRQINLMTRSIAHPGNLSWDCCQSFVNIWVSHFGVPSTIVTDRGRQFESNMSRSLTVILESRKACTTAYHLQANDMIERLHCQLKASLKAESDPSLWVNSLPLVLLGEQIALKEDTHSGEVEIVYCTTLHFQEEFFTPSPQPPIESICFVSQLKSRMK